jgi:hypothetical protein
LYLLAIEFFLIEIMQIFIFIWSYLVNRSTIVEVFFFFPSSEVKKNLLQKRAVYTVFKKIHKVPLVLTVILLFFSGIFPQHGHLELHAARQDVGEDPAGGGCRPSQVSPPQIKGTFSRVFRMQPQCND